MYTDTAFNFLFVVFNLDYLYGLSVFDCSGQHTEGLGLRPEGRCPGKANVLQSIITRCVPDTHAAVHISASLYECTDDSDPVCDLSRRRFVPELREG